MGGVGGDGELGRVVGESKAIELFRDEERLAIYLDGSLGRSGVTRLELSNGDGRCLLVLRALGDAAGGDEAEAADEGGGDVDGDCPWATILLRPPERKGITRLEDVSESERGLNEEPVGR